MCLEQAVIRDRKEELLKFHARYFSEESKNGHYENSNGHHSELTDEEVIELAGRARNSAKFEALCRGDTSGYDSHSEADQALVSLLAFYTQDEEQLDRLYRQFGLCRDKWTERADYRRRTIETALSNLTETYTPDDGARMVVGSDENLSSPSPSSYIDRDAGTEAKDQDSSVPTSPSPYKDEGRGRKPKVVRFSEMKVPGPRRYLLKDLVLASYVTLLHGDGGVAKSLLALALCVAVSGGSERWLRREVENGPVLYLDFELDAEEQVRRVHQLCRGAGLGEPPDGLLYMSALGYTTREAFTAALETCEEHDVKLLVLDSLGPALQGDAEASRDVISFYSQAIEPFRTQGVGVLIIDHQSKLQAGQSYQSKSAFGSVYKNNLARSVIQVEATERGEGTLTLRLRHKKHNFGPLAEPFGATLTFAEDEVALEPIELEASELAEEATLNATDRVKLALEQGPAYPWEIAEFTGLAVKTVKNALTGLRKQGLVQPTGEIENRTERVQLSVPASLAPIRDGDGDGTKPDGENPQDGLLEESVIEREPTGTPPLAVGGWEEV
jgi:hypothetical protein